MLLLVCFSAAGYSVSSKMSGCGGHLLLLHVYADGPDEAEQLPGNRRDDLRLRLAAGRELSEAPVESMLGLPCDRLDVLGLAALARSKCAVHHGPESVEPCGFDQHPPQVTVARLGDGSASRLASTRRLR